MHCDAIEQEVPGHLLHSSEQTSPDSQEQASAGHDEGPSLQCPTPMTTDIEKHRKSQNVHSSMFRFVPRLLRAELLAGCGGMSTGPVPGGMLQNEGSPLTGVLGPDGSGNTPTVIPMKGAIMIADIAGFTSLTEIMGARQGTIGVEILTKVINRLFSEITNIVHSYGDQLPAVCALSLTLLISLLGDGVQCRMTRCC